MREINGKDLLVLLLTYLFICPPFAAAQQPTTPAPAPAGQPLTEPDQSRAFDIPRLLTVWDRIEQTMTPDQVAALKADDRAVKGPQDVIDLFLKYYPQAFQVEVDPKYVDPSTLTPERDASSGLYSRFKDFKKWRTHPVGPEVKGLDDLRAHAADVMYDIDHTPLEEAGFSKEEAANLRAAWERRTKLALEYNWPWALGLAKVDVLSIVHKMGTYKKDGIYHVEVGMLNRLKGKDVNQPVLRLWLSEVQQVTELAFKCRNGFVVQLSVPIFRVRTAAPTCEAVKGQPTKFTSDSQQGNYEVVLSKKDLDVRNSKWTLNTAAIQTGSTVVAVRGSALLPLPQSNLLAFIAEAKEKGNPDAAWYPLSCSINLTKEQTVEEVSAPPPASTPNKPCTDCVLKNHVFRVDKNGITMNISDFVAKGTRLKPGSVKWTLNGSDTRTGDALHISASELQKAKEIQFKVEAEDIDGCLISCDGVLRKSGSNLWKLIVVAVGAGAVAAVLAGHSHQSAAKSGRKPGDGM